MTEENTNEVLPTPPKPAPSSPPKTASADHKVVREAEHKLKEMSRKAKERKTASAHNASKTKALSEVNYFWLVIGGLGALGVGYLVFGPDRRERQPEATRPPKPRQRFKFIPPPTPKTPEKTPVKEDIKKEEKEGPKFELNCF